MEVKLTIIVLVVLTLVDNSPVVADFFFNHPLPTPEHVKSSSRYKCVPGRTIIKITERQVQLLEPEESASDDDYRRNGPTRRKHMTVPTKDEYCRICVCSAEGKDEYCSNRPAANTNECLMLKDIQEKFSMGLPYEHTKSLANRIRRDYLWHNDEIPYSAKAKCFRGHSYYSNSITANNTDVDVGTDIESLLDYDNQNTCYYCVCSVGGDSVGCIHRDVSFCNFYRVIRSDKHIRDRYTSLLEQDRPTYFRQLSWRMRRTMDNGIFDLINSVNSFGNLSTKKKCVPLISQYTNCNDDNICSGCTRCTCTGEGEWSCREVKECYDPPDDNRQTVEEDEEIFDNALYMLEYQMGKKRLHNIKVSKNPYVPAPQVLEEQDDLLAPFRNQRVDEIMASFSRPRRSIAKKIKKHTKRSVEKPSYKHDKTTNSSHNNVTKYYDAIDDLNEDTLKNSNLTGTLVAKKIDMLPPLSGSRRSAFADNSSKSLQIEYNQPKAYNQITDNKIETIEHENKFDSSHENLKTVLGNYTQKTKNKDLSKIVVNELNKGSEIIGDASAPVTSNITFTSENDTLTAMAFIAGNLLNKLWNMEKDASASSLEMDVLKHEKISDLLNLFKEPLNMRQETFLKNALEQLSSAIDKDKDVKNVSICEVIHEDKLLYNESPRSTTEAPCRKNKTKEVDIKQKKATLKAIAKINNVLDLIKKFENVQGNLSKLKHGPKLIFNNNRTSSDSKKHETDTKLTKDEKNSLTMFGSLLEKITKLILPKRNNKKIANFINNQNILTGNDNLKKKFKKMYNIDLSNMTVSAKDKIILDYLTHVEKNPDCLLNNKKIEIEAIPNVEGNILLNISEFFKLKSFSDLIKLLEPGNNKLLRTPVRTKEKTVESTTKEIDEKKISSRFKDVDSNQFNSTKEKLKAHLKTIIEDLIELQSAKGVNLKGNIKIVDALPCIYNVLNAGREEIAPKKEENIDPVKKIASIFQELKKELKMAHSRRSSADILAVRPKSAVVWERLLRNLNGQSDSTTRRTLQNKTPKSYDKIKEMMERIENGSSTYKHYALLVKVPAAGKLILLKALEQDVQATITIIEDILLSFENLIKLPTEKIAELDEFVGNMATGIKLSEKVNEKVKPEPRKFFVNEIGSSSRISKTKLKKKSVIRSSDPQSGESDEMKVSRIQIINQLIRNRLEMFLKMKEDNVLDVSQDMSSSIAQRILRYLDTGNYKLANELFRVFAMQRQNKVGMFSDNEPANDKYVVTSTPKPNETPMRRMAQQKESLVQVEDPSGTKAKYMNWVNQDHLIKQLLNVKNMGL